MEEPIVAQNGDEKGNAKRFPIVAIGASDGLELLKKMESPPDFIFLDLNMPRMNGKQFLLELKKTDNLSSIPVIVYTTSKAEKDKEETRQLGAAYFLSKPSSMTLLQKELEFVFAKKYEKAISEG